MKRVIRLIGEDGEKFALDEIDSLIDDLQNHGYKCMLKCDSLNHFVIQFEKEKEEKLK